ncbi:MAG: Sec-independent protein translocase protein TatB [Hyphomicrobiaceae bacterium]
MFDIGWQELFVLGVLALIVVGPKELPGLLRTIGKYAGMLKKQATEFRGHFEQAMREAELDQLKKDVTGFKSEMEGTFRDAARSAEKELDDAARAAEPKRIVKPGEFRDDDPDAHDEDGIPIGTPPTKSAQDGSSGDDTAPPLPHTGDNASDSSSTAASTATPAGPPRVETAEAAASPSKSGA